MSEENSNDIINDNISDTTNNSNEYLKETEIDINKAAEFVNTDNFDEAIQLLKNRANNSDCSVCKLELNIAVADIEHSKVMCIIGADTCKEEKDVIVAKLHELKEDIKLAATDNINI